MLEEVLVRVVVGLVKRIAAGTLEPNRSKWLDLTYLLLDTKIVKPALKVEANDPGCSAE